MDEAVVKLEQGHIKMSTSILIVHTGANEVMLESYNSQELGLARALSRRGYDCGVVLYTTGASHELTIPVPGYSDIRVYYLHGKSLLKCTKLIGLDDIACQYDIIQLAEHHEYETFRCCGKYRNCYIYHGPYSDSENGTASLLHVLRIKVIDAIFTPRYLRRNVRFLSKSKLSTEYLRTKGITQVSTIGVGLDIDCFTRASTVARKTAKYSLLHVGRLEPVKNQGFLLDVFERCLRIEPEIELTIIGSGEGEYANSLKKRISSSERLSKHVTLISKVKQTEMGSYYQSADLLLLPSLYEIFGMVLLEASWYGCPSVSSLNGGSSMLFADSDCGMIIDSWDVAKWADTIITMLYDQDRRSSLSERARQIIECDFTWNAIVAVHERLFKEILSAEE